MSWRSHQWAVDRRTSRPAGWTGHFFEDEPSRESNIVDAVLTVLPACAASPVGEEAHSNIQSWLFSRVDAGWTVQVRDGLLVVEPRSVDLGGPDVLSEAIAAAARQFVTIEHPIEGLPENLILQDVTVQDDGFRAELAGRDVVLAEGSS